MAKLALAVVVVLQLIASLTEAHSPFKNHGHSGQSQSSAAARPAEQSHQLNPFDLIYQWNILDFQYPSPAERQRAIDSGKFVPENNLPLGLDVWRDRLFITMPRWKNGVPASLAWLPLPAQTLSPAMIPYPNWNAHGDPEAPDCSKLMSVYRLFIDECGRLWVLDAGVVNATIQINPICLPKIVVFDLNTDKQLFSYELPAAQVKEDSLHSNLIVDVREGRCHEAHAYITDVWRFGIVVFSLQKGRSWRTTNHLFLPNPLASDYNLHGLNFQWTDGVFGLSLSPLNEFNDRLMFFHPMSSYDEFMVSSNLLRNESLWADGGFGLAGAFVRIGERGDRGQSSTSGIDRNNVMFYNLVHQDAVGCWDTSRPYTSDNLGVVARDNVTLIFPNDMKVDHEQNQGLWVLSNRLPVYLYAQLDYTDVNFRIQRVNVRDAVLGTCCDRRNQH